ncbi:MAG: DUF4091 domain-containing protein [Ruminococcaceae bacterium]|nr:DUF4091 domain-containing protein [Oscillospiraceae bacterium]
MENTYKLKLVSGMTKARYEDTFLQFPALHSATALRGDTFMFAALASAAATHGGLNVTVTVEGALAPYITTYVVDHVPVRLTNYRDKGDDDYLSYKPGLFPDVLRPANRTYLMDMTHQLYFIARLPQDIAPDTYTVDVVLFSTDLQAEVARETLTLEVLDAVLPTQDIKNTMWFHYDSLADYYNVEVFSERHWEIVESFMKTYVQMGMNTILTPIFTPPLDTVIGGERPTVQLVDVTRENGKYTFSFEKLERFCALCHKLGITDLEIAHFFTQWGAAHAPKIMATDNGTYRRIFGWESEATGEDYIGLLRALIPALKQKLDELGFQDHYFFHISDEPSSKNLESYAAAKNAIIDLIDDHPVRDALSKFDFYQQGVVKEPIVCTDHADTFVKANVPDLWVYYCCSQSQGVSNRFYTMPGYRARVLGAQMYRTGSTGFLQWGYNFYYSRTSQYLINPYLMNDGDFAYPAGDSFAVYPNNDGTPLLSLHGVLFSQALLDLRAMKAAEAVVGRDAVIEAVEAQGRIDYMHYPRTESYLLTLRDTVNRMAAGKK